MADTNKAVSGPRCRLYMNDILVGWAQNIQVNETITNVAIDEFGDIDTVEHEAVRRTVRMSAGFVRILKKDLVKMGIWPSGGTVDVTSFPEMTGTFYDYVNDVIVHRVTGLKAENRNMTISEAGIMMVNASFVARRLYTGDQA